MSWTPNIFIGNTNTYQVTDFRDAVTEVMEDGAEMYLSLCENPPANGQRITDATNDSPIVITSAAHGLLTDDVVTIIDVGGNGAAKGSGADEHTPGKSDDKPAKKKGSSTDHPDVEA